MSARDNISEGDLILWGGAALLLYVWWNGGIAGAAAAAGGAVIDAGVGVIDATGQGVGLPALSDITTDKYVSRYVIDHPDGGYFAASKWSSAAALAAAISTVDEYGGHSPPRGSAIEKAFPPGVGGW